MLPALRQANPMMNDTATFGRIGSCVAACVPVPAIVDHT